MSSTLFELNQLRYFVTVAEELNFRRAARRLNMTQPPLSRHIGLLEHALGVRLFDRSSRSVRLTVAGERFLADAVDILKRAESATLFARQAERGEGGSVILGFVPSASIEIVPRIVTAMERRLPDMRLTLREMMTFEQIEALQAGSLDVGLARLPQRTSPVHLRRIFSEPFVLALPRSHLLAEKPALTIEDIDGEDYIGYSTDRGGFLYEVVSGSFNSVGVRPNIVYSVAQGHTVMSLVDAGLGLGLVPKSNSSICMANTVIRELPLPESFRSDLYLALGPKAENPLVARVVTVIAETLAQPDLA